VTLETHVAQAADGLVLVAHRHGGSVIAGAGERAPELPCAPTRRDREAAMAALRSPHRREPA
jgi:hypothetical protein